MIKRSTGVIRVRADGTSVDEDDDGVLKDGEWVVVSPMIKDASTVPVEDAVAIEDAHTAYVDRLSRRAPAQSTQETTADARDDAIDARAAYVDRLTRRGKGGSVMRDSENSPAKWLN